MVDRYDWTRDKHFLDFEKNVLNQPMTFDEALRLSQVESWSWLDPSWLKATREEWFRSIRFHFGENKTIRGSTALVFLFTSLPFLSLKQDANDISEFLAFVIGRCLFCQTKCSLAGTVFDIKDNLENSIDVRNFITYNLHQRRALTLFRFNQTR